MRAPERLAGYERAMRRARLPAHIVGRDVDSAAPTFALKGYETTMGLFRAEDRPTAVCTSNDVLAVGAYNALKALGLRVPQEVELIGFGDDLEASVMFPGRRSPLSTVRVDRVGLGRKNLGQHVLVSCAHPRAEIPGV